MREFEKSIPIDAEPVRVPPEEAKRLSPDALAARFAVEIGKRERAEEEAEEKAGLEAETAANQRAEDFINEFLDNSDYQKFVKFLEAGDIEGADAVSAELSKQIDKLAKEAPKFAKRLIRIDDMMISIPAAKARAERIGK